MSIDNSLNINDVSKHLVDIFQAEEIAYGEFLSFNSSLSIELNDNMKLYKISNSSFIHSLLNEKEKLEIQITIEHFNKNIDDINPLSYQYKISTGNLIVIILESKDGDNLSSFIMEGNGQLLFDYLSKLISNNIEKSYNPLDEVIEELNRFKPYGNYFK